MNELIAKGGKSSLDNLPSYEKYFDEGDVGQLTLGCVSSFGLGSVGSALNTALKRANVNMPSPVKVSGKKILITFKKGFPLIAVIVAAIIGLSVLYIIIQNWELSKQVASVVLSFADKILPYLPYIIVGVAGIVVVTKAKKLLT